MHEISICKLCDARGRRRGSTEAVLERLSHFAPCKIRCFTYLRCLHDFFELFFTEDEVEDEVIISRTCFRTRSSHMQHACR